MSTDLKLCPFCGGEARTHHMKGYDLWEVSCGQCGVELSAYMCEKDAVNAWNRRTELEVRTAKVEVVEKPNVFKCSECGQYFHRTSWGSPVDYYSRCGAKLDWSAVLLAREDAQDQECEVTKLENRIEDARWSLSRLMEDIEDMDKTDIRKKLKNIHWKLGW